MAGLGDTVENMKLTMLWPAPTEQRMTEEGYRRLKMLPERDNRIKKQPRTTTSSSKKKTTDNRGNPKRKKNQRRPRYRRVDARRFQVQEMRVDANIVV